MSTPVGWDSDRSDRDRSGSRAVRGTVPSPDGHRWDEFDVDHQPGQRRGAHRTATPLLLQQLPWLVVGLVTVTAVVAVVLLLTGDRGSAGGAPQDAPAGTATTDAAATADPAATTDPAPTSAPAATPDRSVRLVVLNGTRVSGLATRVGEELTGLGWSVGTVGNAPDRSVEATVVRWADEKDQVTAEAVATELGVVAERSESAEDGVVVVVGSDRS